MKFHDELNPVLWDKENDNQMRPEVIAKLQEIAEAFIEYLEIPQDAVLDKVVTGSSASYNYNEFSDLDLHIIVDYDKVHEDCPLVQGYLGALKNTFNKEHDITIHDVPVELYAEAKDQGTVHNGLYSVQEEEWIDRPKKIEPTDNDAAVEAKYYEIKDMVDKCNDSETATELLDKIYTMRKAGLAEAGEFCTENLAFKKLRNEGCMDKLRQIKKEQIDKQLSLESYNEDSRYRNFINLKDDDKATIDYYVNLYKNYILNYPGLEPYKQKVSVTSGGTTIPITDSTWNYSSCLEIRFKVALEPFQSITYCIMGIKSNRCETYMDVYVDDDIRANLRKLGLRTTYSNHNTKREKHLIEETNLHSLDSSLDLFIFSLEQLSMMLKNKNESIKESEDELTLEDKLINILTKDGWNHLNGRGGEFLEKDNITIDLYVDSVIFNEFEDDEEELPLETEEDLQTIIQTANELSNKNESIHKLNRTINKAIGEGMEKEPVYHYSVEDIDKQGNDFDNAEEAYEQAQKDLTALGYEVKELNDDGEFEIVSTSTGVAHTGVIYPSNPELDESLEWEICRDMEAGYFYICNDEEIYCDPDGEPYHFDTREAAEEFLHSLNEDAATLEKKMDVAQDTLNDLLKSITDVREDFDLDKAYNLINEALKED